MSGDSIAQRMNAYFVERADWPFGDAELVSGQTLAPFSRAGRTAADNLLAKQIVLLPMEFRAPSTGDEGVGR